MKSVRIGLLWHSPNSGNLGVGALTIANIAILRELARESGVQATFVIFGWVSNKESYIEHNDVALVPVKRSMLNPFSRRILREIRRCQIVFDIGSGDAFSDVFATKRYAYQIFSKFHVLRAGVPLVLSPQTIGPFKRLWSRLLAGAVMKRCISVFARDHLSFEVSRKLGVGENLHESIDVAFALPYSSPGALPGKANDRPRVGLNVSGLLFNKPHVSRQTFGLSIDYVGFSETVIEFFLGHDCQVFLIGHVFDERESTDDDAAAMDALKAMFPAVEIPRVKRTPIDVKSFISSMEFFVGARMHACIAAYSSGVPLVPVAYTRKATGLFGSLGYGAVVDGCRLTTAEALDVVRETFDNRDAMRSQIRRTEPLVARKLDVYRDTVLNHFSQILRDGAVK